MKTIFGKPKNKRLASSINIKSPFAFRQSIRKLSKGGLDIKEFRGLNLAKTRAKLQLRRKNLSQKERKQFREISKIKIPKPRR